MLNAEMIGKAWRSVQPILDRYLEENGDYVVAGMPYSIARDKIGELIAGNSERIAAHSKHRQWIEGLCAAGYGRIEPVD